jgi:anti-anti-sigma regulatory factor
MHKDAADCSAPGWSVPNELLLRRKRMLKVRAENTGDRTVLHCQGKLVRGYETSLLCAALHHGKRAITLDMSEVTTMDAAGIGALISLQAAGIYLQLAGPTHPVLEVLTRTKLDSVFEIVAAAPVLASGAGEIIEASVPA